MHRLRPWSCLTFRSARQELDAFERNHHHHHHRHYSLPNLNVDHTPSCVDADLYCLITVSTRSMSYFAFLKHKGSCVYMGGQGGPGGGEGTTNGWRSPLFSRLSSACVRFSCILDASLPCRLRLFLDLKVVTEKKTHQESTQIAQKKSWSKQLHNLPLRPPRGDKSAHPLDRNSAERVFFVFFFFLIGSALR